MCQIVRTCDSENERFFVKYSKTIICGGEHEYITSFIIIITGLMQAKQN